MSSYFAPERSGSNSVFKRFTGSKALLFITLIVMAGFLIGGCKQGKGLFGTHSSTPKDMVAVFFSKYQGNHSIVEAVTRQVPQADQDAPLQFALTELLKGPLPQEKSEGFYTEIPKGTQLLGVTEHGDTVTVNLSKQFTGGGGSNSMTQRLDELKQTSYAADSEHKLSIEVEGKPLETLGGEGLEVPETIKREQQ
jgi:spore germination protein GerM